MTVGTCEFSLVKTFLDQPSATANAVGVFLPVIVDQSVTAGAQFFRGLCHYSSSVIINIFITVVDEVTVIAAVVTAMIELYGLVHEKRLTHRRVWRHFYPEGVTDEAVTWKGGILSVFVPGQLRGVPVRVEFFSDLIRR